MSLEEPELFLFLHGFGGCARLWAGQKEFFEKNFRVLAVDLPGHGGRPWAGETLADMADGVLADLETSRVKKARVVASSFGGLVALTLWGKRPDLFSGITFSGSIPCFNADLGFPAGLDYAKIRKLSRQLDGDVGRVMDMFVRSLFSPTERASGIYARVRGFRKSLALPRREALKAFLDILETTDLRGTLGRVTCPVRFILGDHDHICPPAVVAPLKALLPSARFDIFQDCGHMPFLTRKEDFNRALAEFLTHAVP